MDALHIIFTLKRKKEREKECKKTNRIEIYIHICISKAYIALVFDSIKRKRTRTVWKNKSDSNDMKYWIELNWILFLKCFKTTLYFKVFSLILFDWFERVWAQSQKQQRTEIKILNNERISFGKGSMNY